MTETPTGPDESVVTGTDDTAEYEPYPEHEGGQDDGETPIPDLDENPEA